MFIMPRKKINLQFTCILFSIVTLSIQGSDTNTPNKTICTANSTYALTDDRPTYILVEDSAHIAVGIISFTSQLHDNSFPIIIAGNPQTTIGYQDFTNNNLPIKNTAKEVTALAQADLQAINNDHNARIYYVPKGTRAVFGSNKKLEKLCIIGTPEASVVIGQAQFSSPDQLAELASKYQDVEMLSKYQEFFQKHK